MTVSIEWVLVLGLGRGEIRVFLSVLFLLELLLLLLTIYEADGLSFIYHSHTFLRWWFRKVVIA